MTNKEAIREITDIYNNAVQYHDDISNTAFNMAIEALEKADILWGEDFDSWYDRYKFNMNALNDYETTNKKYKWHDLRKNPDDLPKFNGKEIEVMFLTAHGFYNIGYYGENGHYRDKYFRNSRDAYEGYDTHCVVAWREIEPLEEEE